MTTQFFDLMLDSESMGLPPTGALIAIGGMFFDLQTQTKGPTFLRTIHLATSVRDGGTMDPSTVLWWLSQSEEARKGVRFGGQDVRKVLQDLSDWIAETCRHEDVRVWSNSPSFDGALIGGAYRRAGMTVPWHWSRERDFRTVKAMNPAVEYDPSKKGDGAHNALADAEFQVDHLFAIANRRKAAA